MDEGRAEMSVSLSDGSPGADAPAGYKRTEMGMIPRDWTLGRLADFGVFRSGSGFPLVHQGFPSGDYPFFKVSDMNNQGNELFMKIANHWISEETRKKLGAVQHPIGSIVFAKIGAAIFLERKRLLLQGSCIDNNMMAFTLTDHHACQRFFYYLLLNLELGKLVSTTALPSLSGRQIGTITVPIPPTDEQRAIAGALSEMDDLLAALEKLIAKKQAAKQAAMQQLLTGKTRLPGFGREWEMKRLGDICAFLSTANNPRADLKEYGEVSYIHYGDVHVHSHPILNCISANLPCIEKDRVGSATQLQDGDLVIVDASEDMAGVGKSIEVSGIGKGRIVAGLHTILCRGNPGRWATGFKAYLQFIPAFKAALAKVATGISVYAISKKQLSDVRLALPSLEEQKVIVAILSDMDAEIASLEQRRDKTLTLKQGMMQQLLTGRVRLVRTDGQCP